MSTQTNQALVLKWLELWNQHALDQLETLVAPNYIHHTGSGDHVDFAAFQKGFGAILHSFPDMHYTVQHWLAQEDLVAVYLTGKATLQAPFFGVNPAGQHCTFNGVYHCRIQDGKIVEDWDIFDLLTALFRLGATVQPG